MAISPQVFQGCGSPRLGRRKRAAVGRGELSQEFLDFSGGKREEKRESENFSISRHVHEIKTKVCITSAYPYYISVVFHIFI